MTADMGAYGSLIRRPGCHAPRCCSPTTSNPKSGAGIWKQPRDGLNVNVFLVRHGDAAPYFYAGREGRYAGVLTRASLRARVHHRGLWGACRHVLVAFDRGVDTGPAT